MAEESATIARLVEWCEWGSRSWEEERQRQPAEVGEDGEARDGWRGEKRAISVGGRWWWWLALVLVLLLRLSPQAKANWEIGLRAGN